MSSSNPYLDKVRSGPVAPILNATQRFFKMEASGGILLVVAAVIALIIANSSLYDLYDYVLNQVKFKIGFTDIAGSFDLSVKKSVLHWINDGFMAVFFFLVGLEIKRELMTGELSSRSRALLPALAAVGGMVVPAAFYYFINMDSPEDLSGWAIPAATDIAFALGILALVGSRAPVRLKILLTAIAIIDDLGAILIIALFYGDSPQLEPLYAAAVCLIGLLVLNRFNVCKTSPYVLIGIILWIAVLKSGIHATLAGVMTAFFIPIASRTDETIRPCETLEHSLHAWVAYGILPIFAFANAGVPFAGMGFHSFLDPVTLGIIAGLVVGKQIGIFGTLVLAIKTGISPPLGGVTWLQLYAVSILCGIGFTMSLFIGGLAFDDLAHQASIRLGVLTGSTISAIMGYLILRFGPVYEEKPEKAVD